MKPKMVTTGGTAQVFKGRIPPPAPKSPSVTWVEHFNQFKKEDLVRMARERRVFPEGTGSGGNITKKDLVEALARAR
jgi:hypothetical protein